MIYKNLCVTTWEFGEIRSLKEARRLATEQIIAINPTQVISIQEKENEIVIWMVI